MLWRARRNDWVSSGCRGRKRQFDEDASILELEIKKMEEHGKLLGNARADALLKMLVPDIAGRLCGDRGNGGGVHLLEALGDKTAPTLAHGSSPKLGWFTSSLATASPPT